METRFWIVVPCYNEEEVLQQTIDRLLESTALLEMSDKISEPATLVFVDDGSRDGTWDIICENSKASEQIIGIKLSHNQGHQNALMAGLMYAKDKCDCVITIDADLQDDISVLPEFLDRFHEGNHIVYGVRNDRKSDTFFKRTTAMLFYKIMNALGANTIYNHADFRLMSRKALEALEQYEESNLFLRGIVPSIGLKSAKVFYSRQERTAGETKYTLGKMVTFALNGITDFSVKPLRIISLFGIICSVLSCGGLLYALLSHFFGLTVPGWTAVVCSIWLLGGIQLLSIGVLGEYIGKIFSETKRRPRYFIEEIVRKK